MEYNTNGILFIVIFSLYVGINSFSYSNDKTKRMILNVAANSENSYGKQIYGIATYNALFKSILNDKEVRTSFLNSFI